MEISDVEDKRQQAQIRWFSTAEICEIFDSYERLDILISEQPERPTSGSFFMIPRKTLRKFRKDGHLWSKKKDGKTIQESHVNLKVDGVEMVECLYVHGQENENFQRRIYRMINGGPLDIVLFHYREDKEARKYCKRNKKTSKISIQSFQEIGKTIPILGITGDGMPNYKSEFENQIFSQETKNDFLPNLDTPGGYYELQESKKSIEQFSKENWKNCKRSKTLNILEVTGLPSSIVNHETVQSLVPSSVDQEGYRLALLSQSVHKSNLNNILGYSKLVTVEGDDNDYEDQSFSQVFENDISPKPGLLGSLCEPPLLMKSMEWFSETCLPLVDPKDDFGDTANESLLIRFEKLLSPSSISPKYDDSNADKITGLINKLISLQKETPEEEILLERKLYLWLLEKVAEGGSGLSVLDEGGAGVIHLAAALGYDWAVEAAIVAAEIDINFRDKNGRTALDWAAHCGRMHTLEFLISNGGAP